jgi:hypothetical protein
MLLAERATTNQNVTTITSLSIATSLSITIKRSAINVKHHNPVEKQ